MRTEILAAVRALLARSGATDVSPAEVVEEMHRRGAGYVDATIRAYVRVDGSVELGPGAARRPRRSVPGVRDLLIRAWVWWERSHLPRCERMDCRALIGPSQRYCSERCAELHWVDQSTSF